MISDGDVVLAESGAIIEYVIAQYGGGRLTLAPEDPHYPDYLYWLHFVNGTLQPSLGRMTMLARAGVPVDAPMMLAMSDRLARAFAFVDGRLTAVPYLAGERFTAADIMTVFTLTTMRYFSPYDLGPFSYILSYLQRIAERPAYRAALEKGDPGMELLLT